MKILFVSAVFENDITGASRFANLMARSSIFKTDILTYNYSGNSPNVISIDIKLDFFRTKIWALFAAPFFQSKINEISDQYDAIIYNDGLLARGNLENYKTLIFIHDDKHLGSKSESLFDIIRVKALRIIERRNCKSGASIIANSQYLKEQIVKQYHVKSEKVLVINQGINLYNKSSEYNHHDLTTKAIPIKVLFIKNNLRRGGLEYLLKALDQMSNFKLQLEIIGPSRLAAERMLVKYPNVEVHLIGGLDNEKVINKMYNSDILCIPAESEALGVAVMEALAIGLPCVTTGVGGLPEVTNNGEFVWQCEPNNPNSIAAKILECIESPELRKSKSEEGRKFVRSKFNFETVENRLLEIIKS